MHLQMKACNYVQITGHVHILHHCCVEILKCDSYCIKLL